MQYIYLIQEREFVRLGEETYKIGRTNQAPFERIKAYPKDSTLHIILKVHDSSLIERLIKEIFAQKYVHMKNYGSEYFNGNVHEMIKDIIDVAAKNFVSSSRDVKTELKRVENTLEIIQEKLNTRPVKRPRLN